MRVGTRVFPTAVAVAAFLAFSGTAQAATGWSAAPNPAAPREGHTASLLRDGKVLVAGGINRSVADVQAAAELFDPVANAWVNAASLASARSGHTATVLPDGRVLVAGGERRAGFGSARLSSAEIYDPVANAWSSAGDMGAARVGHTATSLPNGKVLVAGGAEGFGNTTADLYDPSSNAWSSGGNMTAERSFGHSATLLPDGRVLVAGGMSGGGSGATPQASAEVYDPGTNSWAAASPLAEARATHAAELLADGRVLVTGGFGSGGGTGPAPILATAELFDPASGAWAPAASMGAPRSSHSATRLVDGRVLVAGGARPGGAGSLASSELFDAGANGWADGGAMLVERSGHTATRLADGRVLVVGGGFAAANSAELYGELFQCNDRGDNDADGRVDFPADPGCSAGTDNDEAEPDVTAPDAALGGKRVQRLRKLLAVKLLCRSTIEDCRSVATGRLNVPPAARLFRLKRSALKVVPKTGSATLRLRIPRKARRAAKRALVGDRKVRARIAVRVSDAGGNTRTLRRRIRVIR